MAKAAKTETVKAVKIINTYWETAPHGQAVPKWIGGQTYPVTEESQRQVELGNGEIVDMPAEAPGQAEAPAQAAEPAEPAAGA